MSHQRPIIVQPMDGDANRSFLSELLPDRSVKEPEDDRLRINDVVEELAALSTAVDPPASIALYGPWGSGKSSVCALLRKRFFEAPNTRFIAVDAMKYQELPLRRHFLTQVVSELRTNYKLETDVDLYREETTAGVSLNRDNVVTIAVLVTIFITGAVALFGLLTGLTAWAQDLSRDAASKKVATDWGPTILLTSSLLALPLTLACVRSRSLVGT